VEKDPGRARLVRLLTVPEEQLPKDVALIKKIGTAPLVVVDGNPGIVTNAKSLEFAALFFELKGEADLKCVRTAAVAVYQERQPANEIGVYALQFSDKEGAARQFKKLTADSKTAPFVLKDDVVIHVWKDRGVSDAAFEAVLGYFKNVKLGD
jgi:hypothetical protein